MPKLISRDLAIKQGLSRYFTGKPCANGHVSERRTKHGSCITCTAEARSRYKKSPKGREALHRRNTSPLGHAAVSRCMNSPRGIDMLFRYRNSPKGRATRRAYSNGDKWRMWHNEHRRKKRLAKAIADNDIARIQRLLAKARLRDEID